MIAWTTLTAAYLFLSVRVQCLAACFSDNLHSVFPPALWAVFLFEQEVYWPLHFYIRSWSRRWQRETKFTGNFFFAKENAGLDFLFILEPGHTSAGGAFCHLKVTNYRIESCMIRKKEKSG